MGLMKELNALNDIYQKMYDEEYTVTAADKKGNTPAYQAYKAGKKNVKTGKPLYKAADHLNKEDYETKKKSEVLGAMKKQGRKLSDKEKNKIADKVVKDKGDTSKSDDRYAYEEITPEIKKLIESGKFSKEEIWKIVEVETLDELKKSTLGSYVAKGSKDLANRRFDQGDSEKRKYDPDEADDKEDKKLDKREQGIARAAKKLSKEGYQRDPEGGEEKARQRRRSQKGGDKTEKVRGERTPMPPRGDKRREDFERWYAANVR